MTANVVFTTRGEKSNRQQNVGFGVFPFSQTDAIRYDNVGCQLRLQYEWKSTQFGFIVWLIPRYVVLSMNGLRQQSAYAYMHQYKWNRRNYRIRAFSSYIKDEYNCSGMFQVSKYTMDTDVSSLQFVLHEVAAEKIGNLINCVFLNYGIFYL